MVVVVVVVADVVVTGALVVTLPAQASQQRTEKRPKYACTSFRTAPCNHDMPHWQPPSHTRTLHGPALAQLVRKSYRNWHGPLPAQLTTMATCKFKLIMT